MKVALPTIVYGYKYPYAWISHMVGEVVRRVVDEEPEDGGDQHLHPVGEGGQDRLAAQRGHQHAAGETGEHCRHPAGQRVVFRRHLEPEK